MRRRIVIAAAASVAVLSVVIAAGFWRMNDSGDIRAGHAFGSDDGSYQIGMPTVRAGEDRKSTRQNSSH